MHPIEEAALAEPADLDLQLIYADWLEENERPDAARAVRRTVEHWKILPYSLGFRQLVRLVTNVVGHKPAHERANGTRQRVAVWQFMYPYGPAEHRDRLWNIASFIGLPSDVEVQFRFHHDALELTVTSQTHDLIYTK